MAFAKNWKQFIVSKGEPFLIEFLDRKYGGRSPTRAAFKIDEDGSVLVGGRELAGIPSIIVGGTAASRTVTIQLKDAVGSNLSQKSRLAVWVSDTAGGTPIGADTTGLTTTVTTGVLALTKLANLDFDVISTAGGQIVMTVADAAGAQTRYVNVQVNDKVYSSGAVVTA